MREEEVLVALDNEAVDKERCVGASTTCRSTLSSTRQSCPCPSSRLP